VIREAPRQKEQTQSWILSLTAFLNGAFSLGRLKTMLVIMENEIYIYKTLNLESISLRGEFITL